MQVFKAGLLALACATVAGCGAIPTREEIADRIAERALESVKEAAGDQDTNLTSVQRFERTRRDIEPLSNTAFLDMPTGGAARFAGGAQLTVTPPSGDQGPRRYVGRANVGVDFASETVVGRVDQMIRRSNGRDIAGTLSIRNGDIGVNRPNDFAADLRGTLRDGNATITMDSRILGDFRGTPVRGIAVRNNGSDATWNGRIADHAFSLFAGRE